MKVFQCNCGQTVYFENTRCIQCASALGYAPELQCMLTLSALGENQWLGNNQKQYRLCKNHIDYQLCNWLVPLDSNERYCLSCRLNQMIPALIIPERRQWWSNIEAAKRRLLYSLLQLNLPLQGKAQDPAQGLAFAFMEDQRHNPWVTEEFVLTGHAAGLITVNLAEADDIKRERTRQHMGEAYRTLLGHFRHESGHYYFDRLIANSHHLQRFRELFGDETRNYEASLNDYYANPKRNDWQNHYISAYAQAHPLEDWAESWAHYLHMIDTLETGSSFGIINIDPIHSKFDDWLENWMSLTVALNALNRSMGVPDAYPFVLSATAITKLRFVHQLIDPMQKTTPREATD